MLTREDGHRLSQVRRSLGEEKGRHSSGGAAYMQLFNGEGKGKYKWKRMELKLKI